ncbi:sulfurtransferase complex subunit TusC [Aliikangiella sp. IMCC44632]
MSTSIVIESPPFSRISAKEGVDLALVCAAFEQSVNLIFVEDGVYHLLNAQDDSAFPDKNHDKQLKSLEYYDIDNILVETESLQSRGLEVAQLIDKVSALSSAEIKTRVSESDQCLVF